MKSIEELLAGLGIHTKPTAVPGWPGAPLQMLEVPGAGAEELWRALRAEASATGIWPLIVTGNIDLISENAQFSIEDGSEVPKLLDEAWDIDVPQWLAARRTEEEEDEEGEFAERVVFDVDWDAQGGDLDIDAVGGHREEGKYRETVSIWLVPAQQGWEVPAHLFLGSWNEVPETQQLVALLRSWKKRFGADLFSITHDRMEFDVQRPPTDRAAVEDLAVEQYLVCRDLVDQGYEEISRLASALAGAKAWWFWWD